MWICSQDGKNVKDLKVVGTDLLSVLRAEGGGLKDHHGVGATQQYGGRGHPTGAVSDLGDVRVLHVDPLFLCLTFLDHVDRLLKTHNILMNRLKIIGLKKVPQIYLWNEEPSKYGNTSYWILSKTFFVIFKTSEQNQWNEIIYHKTWRHVIANDSFDSLNTSVMSLHMYCVW